ncbi:serine/threonine-protein kinase MARK2 [Cricetulus griseus]|uniref:non-specific serine/threonine protein kinase n=1 Tax=Cricetulus griseus TaxID=10029 RepID=A0A061HVG9_CRIGR|nr:serine/threonine-protein kinase MARK2 [Cricetulus griseus]
MNDRWMKVGHEDNELTPYVEPLPDYKETRRTELMVLMGYTREEIRDSLVGQRYKEAMATYLLRGYKSSELEGDTITLKARPSADVTNSSAPSPSHKAQHSVCANPKQRRPRDQAVPAIPTSNSYSKKTQSNNAENKQLDRAESQQHFQSACQPSAWSTDEEDLSYSLHKQRLLHPAQTQAGTPPLLDRASLGQSSIQNGKDSLTMLGSRASMASASAAVSAARPCQHQKSMPASLHPNKASGLPPRRVTIDLMTEKWVVAASVEVLIRFPLLPGEDPTARCVSNKNSHPEVSQPNPILQNHEHQEKRLLHRELFQA